jgi:hypothetical protein
MSDFTIDENLLEDDPYEDTPVIAQLRKQLRDANRELRRIPDQIQAARQSWEKAEKVAGHLESFGHPRGILDEALRRLGDAEASREAVGRVLQDIGYSLDAPQAPQPAYEAQAPVNEALRHMSSLSAAVASASSSSPADVASQIASTQSSEELLNVMRANGLASE